ncbi:class I histocompatibility antigen, F10 alpha chain-like [Acipenser ruthenus]|uniref:class I histocompatibility antigen, F10 alpha chain-like n=1 Tax=Acipenser ruthenus TaxID=7906 RepID=UPI002741BB03|nr:class I histocompatibility antigen, F10 alpha chain-like [Acipenser ruthenus]
MLRAFVLAILCCVHVASGEGSHSLRYFYTGTSGMTEFPEFVVVGMVDDVQIDYYDSKSKQNIPKQQWMKDNMEPGYWETQTHICRGAEQIFRRNIGIAMQRFNQTGGVHSWQHVYGCELDEDGTKRGFDQYGYDGEDYISFDTDTLTWTAASQRAFATKLKWEANGAMNQDWKGYLEWMCIEWQQKYVQYGRETLERRVPPAVTLLQRKARGSADTEVLCHVTGFFPRAVEVTWVRDGRDQLEEGVQSGEVLPNQDGTYQLRKILTVSPEEQRRHNYSCQVDHASLDQKIVKEWDPNSDGGPPIGIIAGVIVGVLALAAVIIGVVIWKKKQGGRSTFGIIVKVIMAVLAILAAVIVGFIVLTAVIIGVVIWMGEGGPPIGIIAGVIVGVLALAAVIIGVVIWKKKQGGAQRIHYTSSRRW